MTGRVVRLTIPAKAEYLLLARLALAGVARHAPIEELTLADLKLAVTEICANAVRHAYEADAADAVVRIEISIADDDTEIGLTVADDGRGSAGANGGTAEPLLGPAEGGMGLAIARSVVDELTIEPGHDGVGTIVRMRKRLDS